METPAFRATSFNVTIGYPFLCVLRCNCCIAAIHYNEVRKKIESLRFFEDESRSAMRQVFAGKNVSVTIDRPI